MISLEQWRVVIASWHAWKRFAGGTRGRFPKCNLFNLKLYFYVDDIHDELCALHNFDLIGVSESHLDNNIVDS